MTINIAHLYYDILNLYGESGNIKAIKNFLESQDIKVNIKFITLNDEIKLENIDLLYIGSGTENNQDLVLKHITKYKKEINNFIENNKFIIATGNSIELFGKSIDSKKALNIFNYSAKRESFRIVDEALFKCDLINDYVIGFQNQGSVIKDIDSHIFKVIKGTGSYPSSNYEGFNYKNFYGSYLIGPLLVRNPKLLIYLMNKLIKSKNEKFKKIKNNLTFEQKATKNFLKICYNIYK